MMADEEPLWNGFRLEGGMAFKFLNCIIDVVLHVAVAKTLGTDIVFECSANSMP